MSNPLLDMQRLGQSPWHDNIQRNQLTSGKLQRMVEDGDITGLTSNPTIFQQAIEGTPDYDEQLAELARAGKSARDIFYTMAIDDLRDAADVFRPVYDRTGGRDGFVSLECAPDLAYDTPGTIEEAQRLWDWVDRPNLMVKIPATKQGLPAIEESIAAGINVNVTLIFSLERYEEVMDAYLKGLIRRHQDGKPVSGIASVASFFVSRVDTLVDGKLDAMLEQGAGARWMLESLKGKAAIANARLAFQQFRKKFATEAAAALVASGAQLQRPLWASTSTKNPKFPDTYYVDALIGPDSVDTMPPATIEAVKDHGNPAVRIDRGVEEARIVMHQLDQAGIDMAAVTQKLEEDGVRSFADSFESLIATIEERRVAAKKGASASAAKRSSSTKRKPAAKAKRVAKAVKKAPARAKRAAKAAKKGATKKMTSVRKAAKSTVKAAKKKAAKVVKAVKKKATKVAKKAKKKAAPKKKAATKKSTARKTAAKKSTARKPAKKKTAARKPAKKKTAARKAPAKRKTTAKKAPAKRKAPAKKRAPAKKKAPGRKGPKAIKAPGKKGPARKATRR